jgi:hypothetical protein
MVERVVCYAVVRGNTTFSTPQKSQTCFLYAVHLEATYFVQNQLKPK